jgi:carboxypeptidase Taq
MPNDDYPSLLEHVRETSLLCSSAALLEWDQETMMPTGGEAVDYRARQMAQLAQMIHQKNTDPRIEPWLAACEADETLTADPTCPTAVNLREIRHQYDRATRLPEELVIEFSQTTSRAKHYWAEARKNNDFAAFEPWLSKTIDLNRQRARCWGWPEEGEPWDALAEGFEPGMTAAAVEKVFTPLRDRLTPLIAELTEATTRPSDRLNRIQLPIAQQRRFVRDVIARIGFQFDRGRLDESTHPFCSGTHRDDVRLTTRFHEEMLNDALGSTLHESGHGIYEQNLPGGEHLNTPYGSSAGLAVHESQSRLIENQLGRSRAFWTWCHPRLSEYFGHAVKDLTPDDCYQGANRVMPGLIRVEADEATYNLHIMIRFELERALVQGDLTPSDLPGAWKEKYATYLGVEVPDDTRGCMQDIHWSMGAMGYFPTYTIGTMLAAQFFETALARIPDLYNQFARGQFDGLIGWLNQNVHRRGPTYYAAELCETVTGQPLSADPLIRHLENKLKLVGRRPAASRPTRCDNREKRC